MTYPTPAEETRAELATLGFETSLEFCERVMGVMYSEGKEAAANLLRTAGIPVETERERFNTVEFKKWTIKGFT
jgi:hypothetical protein